MLYDKWWKNDPMSSNEQLANAGMKGGQLGNDQKCKKRSGADNMANALGVVNIGGIFVVLLCGLAFAITIAIIEFCWKTSSINTSGPAGINQIMQTSPNRRNSRRKSISLKIRTRKSLCAEIAGTLVPFFNYSNKTMACVEKNRTPKGTERTVRGENDSHNQTVECNMHVMERSNSSEFEGSREHISPSQLAEPINNLRTTNVSRNQQTHGKRKEWQRSKRIVEDVNDLACENTYDDVPKHCHVHGAPSDDEDYFYRPSMNNKHQDQFISNTKKLKRTLNHSLPTIPPVVPPHANEGTIVDEISTRHRVYVPSLDR